MTATYGLEGCTWTAWHSFIQAPNVERPFGGPRETTLNSGLGRMMILLIVVDL